MSTARDTLARAIFIIDNRLASNPAREWDEASPDNRYYAYAIAEGLIEAGYGSQHDAWHVGWDTGWVNAFDAVVSQHKLPISDNPYPKTAGA